METIRQLPESPSQPPRAARIDRPRFSIMAPDPRLIDPEHVAHALANLPMYNGLTERTYTIAQHAVSVAKLVPSRCRLAALLYHAPAAYMGDISLVRELFPALRETEERVRSAVYVHYGLGAEISAETLAMIHSAEAQVAAAEHRDLLGDLPDHSGASDEGPASAIIHPITPTRAKHAFLTYLRLLEMSGLFCD